jgi:hypothetical protein
VGTTLLHIMLREMLVKGGMGYTNQRSYEFC